MGVPLMFVGVGVDVGEPFGVCVSVGVFVGVKVYVLLAVGVCVFVGV